VARDLGHPLFADASPVIVGNDHDLEVLVAAKGNASRAGVTGRVTWRRGDLASLSAEAIAPIAEEQGRAPGPGLILANPPYGERMDDADLRLLYGELGDTCRRFPGWRAGFLVASPDGTSDAFERWFGGRPTVKKPLSNANLRGNFLLYEL
jgi:23S rRNA G2445 N2-methylase RlmL